VKKKTLAPLLLSKFIKTPPGVHFCTLAPVRHCWLLCFLQHRLDQAR